MPLFAIVARDKPDHLETRMGARPDHVAHLNGLGARLKAAGPMLDADDKPMGSLVVFEAGDVAAARAFAEADPYAAAGLFADVQVVPFNALLGTWPNAEAARDEEE